MRIDENAMVPPDVLAIVQLSRLCCYESDERTTSHVYQRHRMGEGQRLASSSITLAAHSMCSVVRRYLHFLS